MSNSLDANLHSILEQAITAIQASEKPAQLEDLRVNYLGKKGELTNQLKQIGSLPHEERPKFGDKVNAVKQKVAQLLNNKKAELDAVALAAALAAEKIDITLPGRGISTGGVHPVTRTMQRIEDIFVAMGFGIATGPEIEDDFHNAKNDFELKKARELAYQKRWYASKIRPAQYGSTVNIDHSGKVDVSDAQLDARIVALGSAISTAIAEATSGGVDGAASGEEEAS